MKLRTLSWFVLLAAAQILPASRLEASVQGNGQILSLREQDSLESNPHYQEVIQTLENPDRLERAKVLYLIKLIELSPHRFERNGSVFTSRQAAMHLRRKFFSNRFRKGTARDFIFLIASRSSKSGKPYFIIDDGERKFLSRDILIHELTLLEKHLEEKTRKKEIL